MADVFPGFDNTGVRHETAAPPFPPAMQTALGCLRQGGVPMLQEPKGHDSLHSPQPYP